MMLRRQVAVPLQEQCSLAAATLQQPCNAPKSRDWGRGGNGSVVAVRKDCRAVSSVIGCSVTLPVREAPPFPPFSPVKL